MDPVTKANRASRILQDEVFAEAVRNTHIRFFERWLTAEMVEEREQVYAERKALDALMVGFREIINEGAVEYHNRGGDVRDEEWSTFPGQDD